MAADKGHGVTLDLTHYEAEDQVNTLNSLHKNNLLWLRQPIRWRDIEPAPGEFNWTALDAVFAAVNRHNQTAPGLDTQFKVIAVLHTAPDWARPANAPTSAPPHNLSDFGRFARAVATRYGRQLDYYQIWHEPNLSSNWGDVFVNPNDYAQLLREAALNIRAADPTALILTAALAPTRETGPLNLNEMDYLDQLYRANAAPWFDVVAGQPYGFDFEPDSPPNPDILNFRRLELLRQVMLQHSDAKTPIWATATGWNALPATWQGQPSPWRDDQTKTDPPELQAQRTAAGLDYARRHWPWLGPRLAVRWDSHGLAADDPGRGFALSETALLDAFSRNSAPDVATVGRYPADHPSGHTSPGWRTAQTLADVPRSAPRTLTISFEGTRLDLTVQRGDYRGYLWVTIDDGPANALPHDTQGSSYVVLYDPQRRPATVTLAQNLPPGRHRAVIEADGGWEQWAIGGWTVANHTDSPTTQPGLLLAGLLLVVSGLGLLWQSRPALSRLSRHIPAVQRLIPVERVQVGIIFGLAVAVYFAPDRIALGLPALLALAIIYRPDLGLALIAFSLSFFQASRPLPIGTISLIETPLLLAAGGVALRAITRRPASPPPKPRVLPASFRSLDWAALALLALGCLSTLVAPNFGINMHAWRLLIFGPVLYYFMVRLGLNFGPKVDAPLRWAWRLIDALVAGAALHAAIVLWGYLFNGQFVATEGVGRALSPVYASPNNLALYLGRVLPILLAVALLPRHPAPPHPTFALRRALYSLGAVLVGLALYFTYSRGALLVGLPAGLATMALLYGLRHPHHWRRVLWVVTGGLAVADAALLSLGRVARFQTVLALDPGSTAFFRLKLWQASLTMLRDFWPLGIGPGNFLYLYRTRYILPEAWPEPNLSHPHNLILDFATRLGIGGVVILIWLQFEFWRQAWRLYQRRPTPLVLGLMGSMVVTLSHGLIDNAYFLVDLAYVFFLTMGVVQGSNDISTDYA